mgnify:CR=1 FL=1
MCRFRVAVIGGMVLFFCLDCPVCSARGLAHDIKIIFGFRRDYRDLFVTALRGRGLILMQKQNRSGREALIMLG